MYLNTESLTKQQGEKLMPSNKDIARCVGLWLAEGDNKTRNEITFTNNCIPLIELFEKTIVKLFEDKKFNPRVYCYAKEGEKIKLPAINAIVKYYIDNRARQPYYIFRIASVELTKMWHDIVDEFKTREEYYQYILQGFFAGEGNVKHLPNHHHRSIRISQKDPNEFVERILDYFDITYVFKPENRMYDIYNQYNFNRLNEIGIANLHPVKKEQFKVFKKPQKEIHYSPGYLKQQVFKELIKPKTTLELSKKYERSFARLQDVLIELKKENKIQNFHVGSHNYWIRRDQNIIIIGRKLNDVLRVLKKPLRTVGISKELVVSFDAARKRLAHLERLGLISRNDKLWFRKNSKRVIVVC